jgi:hypothetical protein
MSFEQAIELARTQIWLEFWSSMFFYLIVLGSLIFFIRRWRGKSLDYIVDEEYPLAITALIIVVFGILGALFSFHFLVGVLFNADWLILKRVAELGVWQ